MKLNAITTYLENIAPLDLQEPYDNAGLLIGNPEMNITGALCTLDCTEEVLDEALKLKCNLVVAHHPIIFKGIRKFTDYYVHRVIQKAIINEIAIYAIHTNLDNVMVNGVNERIAQTLELRDLSILRPNENLSSEKQIGSGIIGYLKEPLDTTTFFDRIKTKMHCSVIRFTKNRNRLVQKVACCGGSGSFLLEDAKANNCDIFITSDFKYHEFFEADDKIIIADIGHYETEQFTKNLLSELISNKFPNFAAHYSKVNTNPVFYYQ